MPCRGAGVPRCRGAWWLACFARSLLPLIDAAERAEESRQRGAGAGGEFVQLRDLVRRSESAVLDFSNVGLRLRERTMRIAKKSDEVAQRVPPEPLGDVCRNRSARRSNLVAQSAIPSHRRQLGQLQDRRKQPVRQLPDDQVLVPVHPHDVRVSTISTNKTPKRSTGAQGAPRVPRHPGTSAPRHGS